MLSPSPTASYSSGWLIDCTCFALFVLDSFLDFSSSLFLNSHSTLYSSSCHFFPLYTVSEVNGKELFPHSPSVALLACQAYRELFSHPFRPPQFVTARSSLSLEENSKTQAWHCQGTTDFITSPQCYLRCTSCPPYVPAYRDEVLISKAT